MHKTVAHKPKMPTVTVSAYRRSSGGLSFYCEYCGCAHHHGAPEGHRAAHCKDTTPFSITGYNLIYVGEYTEEVKAEFKRRAKEHKQHLRMLRNRNGK